MQQSDDNCEEEYSVTFLVVGGGIAGVSCAEMLAIRCPEESTLLLTESSIIKTVANIEPVARYLHKFDVKERSALASMCVGDSEEGNGLAPCITTIVDKLKEINSAEHFVMTHSTRKINYKYLCLCTGGRPKLIADNNPLILGIRDTDSVLELQKRLKNARSVVVVGNGGIASELVYELKGVRVHWVVKDKHISSTFVDPGAAHFFLQSRHSECRKENAVTDEAITPTTSAIKRLRYEELSPNPNARESSSFRKSGPALGPDWHRSFALTGSDPNNEKFSSEQSPIIHYKAQIQEFERNPDESAGNLKVRLTNGDIIECDFIVSATGVDPNHSYSCDHTFNLAADGGIAVNELMQTNLQDIYAAGDLCTATWDLAEHWFQMRLWTQARQMGSMAASAMSGRHLGESVILQDFCFEIFGHVTQLFGFSIVLLGRFNGQGLGTDYEILLRTTPNKEYIKFVILNGRLKGAILIGNTELAETCENLILNAIDLTPFGDDILNPDIDIEDYFD